MKRIKEFFTKVFDGILNLIGKIPAFFRKIRDFFRRHKHLRRTVAAVLLIFLAGWLFFRFWPPFSAHISGVNKRWYLSRAVNYDGERFSNIGDFDMSTEDTGISSW